MTEIHYYKCDVCGCRIEHNHTKSLKVTTGRLLLDFCTPECMKKYTFKCSRCNDEGWFNQPLGDGTGLKLYLCVCDAAQRQKKNK
jgi:hypothetical protein